MTILEARILRAPRLRFDPIAPSRIHTRPYQGLLRHGPYDSSSVSLSSKSLLFVFPDTLREPARQLWRALTDGFGSFPGLEKMFRIPFARDHVDHLSISGDVSTPIAAAKSYRKAIEEWSKDSREVDPQLALVIVPHSERWQTERPYYEAKAAFARLGIPTQMVTEELLKDEREFTWSVANIALAVFAKLGGVPWVIDAPPDDHDLVVGVGRTDIRRPDGVKRIFGYALSFISNGAYRQTWAFTPVADEDTYGLRLEEELINILKASRDVDQPFRRLVIHLAKRTGLREIEAVQRARSQAGANLPTALLRLDDTTLYDIADGRSDHFAPPKGLAVRLGPQRLLLQPETVTPVGAPSGPLLVELDRRSDVGPQALSDLAAQTYRLAHTNWRAFNAISQPVTLVYGRLLAQLVGYLEEVPAWDPTFLRRELRDRPWFL